MSTNLDLDAAHKYFAVQCFNKTWEFLSKPERTQSEDEEMLELCFSSFWHWRNVKSQKPVNLSIGYWQLSRVHAVLGKADDARYFGERCLETSEQNDVGDFFVGYAHEALARAELVAGNKKAAKSHLKEAFSFLEKVAEQEDRDLLSKDLQELQAKIS
jgi:lipopolysaccharide biosynthesis regulator YciM